MLELSKAKHTVIDKHQRTGTSVGHADDPGEDPGREKRCQIVGMIVIVEGTIIDHVESEVQSSFSCTLNPHFFRRDFSM